MMSLALPRQSPARTTATAVHCLLLAAALLNAVRLDALSSPAFEVRSGELISKVLTRADPRFSYALYLPAAYSPERTWPTLFVFDARGRGSHAAERFVPAAEKYGWIVISSNDSRSDELDDPNVAAARAMWNDASARYSIDTKRVYASGFSGGARAACNFAFALPNSVRGVIGAGGGFPVERQPSPSLPFAFFGTAGERDFNYYEMQLLDRDLARFGANHRLVIFDGVHEWMPTDVATQAIEWLEIVAMRSGHRTRDLPLAISIARERAALARAQEPIRPLDAWLAWDALLEDFTGVLDAGDPLLATAKERATRLKAEPTITKAKRLRERSIRRDLEQIARAQTALAAVSHEDAPTSLARLLAQLRVRDLMNQAKDADRDRRFSAQRVLATYRVQTSFYLPRESMARKDWHRAELCLEIATVIEPRDPETWLRLAEARAQGGSKKRAIEALKHAVEAGLNDRTAIEKSELLAPLRSEEEFQKLVAATGPR